MSTRVWAIALAVAACAPAFAQVTYFNNQANFTAFVTQNNKHSKGVETFESTNVGQGGKQALVDPLVGGVPNVVQGVGFPNGLSMGNLRIQANILPGPNAPVPAPSGNPFALYVGGPGFIGAPSSLIGEDLFLFQIQASIDLIFPQADKTAVSFDLSRFQGYGMAGWTVGVFGAGNVLLGSVPIPAPSNVLPVSEFVGLYSTVPIYRINIYDPLITPEGIDNIEMFQQIPTPGAAALLGLAALATRRRRT
jgi:hypothetical protein